MPYPALAPIKPARARACRAKCGRRHLFNRADFFDDKFMRQKSLID
jgi:hypothetical protein